jgi:hypothetical protein
MAVIKLDPSLGPAKWRSGLVARFQFNAKRCRAEASRMADAEERALARNVAELWEQLADAAGFKQELSGDAGAGASRRRWASLQP